MYLFLTVANYFQYIIEKLMSSTELSAKMLINTFATHKQLKSKS